MQCNYSFNSDHSFLLNLGFLCSDGEDGTTGLNPSGVLGLAPKASSSTGYQLFVEQLFSNGVRSYLTIMHFKFIEND